MAVCGDAFGVVDGADATGRGEEKNGGGRVSEGVGELWFDAG